MARFEDGCYGSLKGIALIAKVLAGRCQMHYTRVAVGKGTIPDDLTPKTIDEPPEYVMDAIISSVTNPVDGECQVAVQINSQYVKDGFYATWLILYAEDPDEGEVSFTTLCLENEPEWIRPSSSVVGKLAHFDMIAAVGDVDSVSATIDPRAIVTRAEVEQLIAAATAVLEITIPKEGWTDGNVPNPGDDEEADEAQEPDMEDGSGLRVDIPISGVTEAMQPFVSVHPAHLETAKGCQLSTAARTIDGAVRLYAKSAPTADMTATLTLLCASSGTISGAITSSGLPIASRTTPGAVKPGAGLSIAADGTLSVDIASDADASSAIEGVFSK